MRKTAERRDHASVEHFLALPVILLQNWYQVTTPTFSVENSNLKQREMARQAHLTSTISLLSLLILFPVFLGAMLATNMHLLLIIILALLFQGIAIWLNRQQKILAAGLIVVLWFILGLSIFLITTPERLDVANLTDFYLPVETELLAVSLLPAWIVFPVTIYNCLLIEILLFWKPHTSGLDRLLAISSYQISLQPVLLQIVVAVVSYLWVKSATQAIIRADRAEEIAQLTQTIALQNQQRMEALQVEQQITQAYEHQRKLNQQKDEFLVNVSHELRTPLSAVEGYLDLLKNHHEHLDTSELSILVAKAIEGCEDLTSLVNRVLEAVYINQNHSPIHCETLAVKQMVQESITHLDPREVTTHKIEAQIDEQLLVWADPHSCQLILSNLLSNACKYTPGETTIRIEATQNEPTAPITISVQDEGPGIPAEERPLLFEKFVRLKRDQAGATRGMGLGLYISKCLVEEMAGQIWVESSGRTKEGSRFTFTLPPPPQE